MTRFYFIDDDPDILSGIAGMFEEKRLECQCVGTATNLKKALKDSQICLSRIK